MSRTSIVLALAVSAALSLPAVAAAQGPATATVVGVAPEIPSGWRFEVQPFAWLPVNVTGDATVRDRRVPFDVSGEDIIDKLELLASLRFEAWNGHYGLALDGIYTRMGSERTAGNLPFDLTARTFQGDVLGGYRVGPGPLGDSAMMLDLFTGIRVVNLSQDLEIGGADLSADQTEVKGVGAVRGLIRLSRVWVVGARALAAGPDLTWSAGLGFEADVSLLAIKFGYAFEDVSVESDRLELDTFAHGPYVGLGIRFGSAPIY